MALVGVVSCFQTARPFSKRTQVSINLLSNNQALDSVATGMVIYPQDSTREGTFLIKGGGGGPGLQRGGSVVKFLKIGEDLFCSQLGEGHTFFHQGKNYFMSILLKLTLFFYLPTL